MLIGPLIMSTIWCAEKMLSGFFYVLFALCQVVAWALSKCQFSMTFTITIPAWVMLRLPRSTADSLRAYAKRSHTHI